MVAVESCACLRLLSSFCNYRRDDLVRVVLSSAFCPVCHVCCDGGALSLSLSLSPRHLFRDRNHCNASSTTVCLNTVHSPHNRKVFIPMANQEFKVDYSFN